VVLEEHRKRYGNSEENPHDENQGIGAHLPMMSRMTLLVIHITPPKIKKTDPAECSGLFPPLKNGIWLDMTYAMFGIFNQTTSIVKNNFKKSFNSNCDIWSKIQSCFTKQMVASLAVTTKSFDLP
jgi:hypothetical protein